MDVWSLGSILGYMLLNGEPLFSNPNNIIGEVFSFLGNPTVHEMREGLLANYGLSSYGGRIALQNLQKKFGKNGFRQWMRYFGTSRVIVLKSKTY